VDEASDAIRQDSAKALIAGRFFRGFITTLTNFGSGLLCKVAGGLALSRIVDSAYEYITICITDAMGISIFVRNHGS
jgi:hypothetical protein